MSDVTVSTIPVNADPTVTYRPIPSLPEEFYRAGSDGSIWSCQKPGMGAGKVGGWRRLKEVPRGDGYRGVVTGVNGKRIERYVHQLVLEAFVGLCPPGMECCHGDGNKENNRLDNLRWGTPVSNAEDKARHGTQLRGSRIPWSKLTEADIPTIRTRQHERAAVVAKDYKVDEETIRNVWLGRTWKHV